MSRSVTRIVCGVALTTTLVLAVHQPRRPARRPQVRAVRNPSGNSRLWRLRFDDPSDPARGGVIDMLLGGDEDGGTGEAYHMLDNMTINRYGQLVLQEDTGNNRYLARIWLYDIASDTLTEVGHHDPDRFGDGVIDVSAILGSCWFLLDVQAHYNPGDPKLVEGCQLLAMHFQPGKFR